MSTSFTFTFEQLSQISQLRATLVKPENKSLLSGAVPLYAYIFKCITGIDLNDSSYANNATSVFDTLAQRLAQGAFNEDVYRSAMWLYGAIQVNSDSGAFSMIIREYNIRQGELRLGRTFTADELQEASNAVGLNLASSILDATTPEGELNLGQGKLPTVQEIGANDLLGVRNTLYPGNETPGTELYLNQAWPGIVMLGALGGQYTDRLLRYDTNQPSVLDNDVLDGGTGSDVYVFGRGGGRDTVNNYDTGTTQVDTIQFAADITPSDITVTRAGSDLLLTIADSGDEITVLSYFSNDGVNSYGVEEVRFSDGTVWNLDTIKVMALRGTAGNDDLYGYETDDILSGGDGNDYLAGNGGNDILDGGAGNDVFNSGTGSDVYLFGRGDGQDTIYLNRSSSVRSDIIQFDSGITPDDVMLSRSNDYYLVIAIAGSTDNITVPYYFGLYGIGNGDLESIRFADNTIWDFNTVATMVSRTTTGDDILYGYETADTLSGGDGNDQLYGYGGNDLLDGGKGNDYLVGNWDNDTYLFGKGDGQDTVYDYDTTVGNTDVLSFSTDITSDQLWFRKLGLDLEISIIGTNDKVTISDWYHWYSSSSYHIEQFRTSDGKVLLDSQVDALVSAMAAFAPPAAGQTTLAADYQTALNPVIAANWQ